MKRPFILISTNDDVPEMFMFVDSIVCINNNQPNGCIVYMGNGVINNFLAISMEKMCQLVEDSMAALERGEKQ
jgi:hypothetical protein